MWYHFVQRYTDRSLVAVVIYDCGSGLRDQDFPGAHIIRHRNVDHGRKIDHCVHKTVKTPLLFLSDDDSFLVSSEAEPLAADALLSEPNAAAFSFHPRGWWEFEIDGQHHPVMGSYSVVFKPEVVRQERLSFRTRPTDDPRIRQQTGYYDTADYVNESMIRRGYEIVVAPPELRGRMVKSYSAVSSGFVNFARRNWFRRQYRLSRPPEAWIEDIVSNPRMLEHACGVAGAVELYRNLFADRPRFDRFFTYDQLAEAVERSAPPAVRTQAVAMVTGYRGLLEELRGAA